MTDRQEFEQWITGLPYELTTKRFTAKKAWPGQYQDYKVQIAWNAWQESRRVFICRSKPQRNPDSNTRIEREVPITQHSK